MTIDRMLAEILNRESKPITISPAQAGDLRDMLDELWNHHQEALQEDILSRGSSDLTQGILLLDSILDLGERCEEELEQMSDEEEDRAIEEARYLNARGQ